jgi:sec-independent protein translocase protein TatB
VFDVSFGEMLVIAIVALIVIGPEKLPKVARTMGLLAGRMQRYVNNVKGEIEQELRAEELRKMHQEVTQGVQGIANQIHQEARQVESEATSTLSLEEHKKSDV